MIIDIYGIGVLISGILAVIFTFKEEKEKAWISLMILLFILLLKYILTK